MTRRERFIQLLTIAITIGLSVLGARFGIPIPPPVVPPIDVPPPIITFPPMPPGPGIPSPVPDPPNAIVRLSFQGVGCSATVIGPKRQDGRWYVMSAAHCVKDVGQHGTIRFLSGKTTGVQVIAFDRKADVSWMVTESNSEEYPYALLAKTAPTVGTKIWHAGYGVDKPGNREDGEVLALPDTNGQIRFRLSVSSGDSGGGILLNSLGEVVSCVCCTASRGHVADTWGVGPDAALRAKPTVMVLDDWTPIDVPIRMPPKP